MGNKKKKVATSAIAVILAAALALAGTFAWSSDDSSDGDEEGVKAPNVRLHDDNDKTNIAGLTGGTKYRKIYVENTGDVNLYVRVKLSEYMNKGGRTLIEGTSKNDKTKWKARYSDDGLEFSGTEIDKYISLDTGKGETTNYVKDRKNNYSDGTDAVAAETEASKKGITPAGQVMTMRDWNRLGAQPTVGCWVLDTDGYAYWSQKLAADEATCLLLNTITINDIDESYYYGLSASMEAVTESDVEHWMDGTKLSGQDKVPSQASKDATGLLKSLSSNYVKITTAMRATIPSGDAFDDDGDGYLTSAQKAKYDKAVVKVTAAIADINAADTTDATKNIVTIDGTEWRVLSKNANQAELMTKEMVTSTMYHSVQPYPTWKDSDLRTYLNEDYYPTLGDELKAMIQEETLKTPKAFDKLGEADMEESVDKVYVLTEGVDSTPAYTNKVLTPSGVEVTVDNLKCGNTAIDGRIADYWWLRTSRYATLRGSIVNCSSGVIYPNGIFVDSNDGVRPAITVRLK